MFKRFAAKLMESPEMIAGGLFLAILVIVSIVVLTSGQPRPDTPPASVQRSYEEVYRQFKLSFFEQGITREDVTESNDNNTYRLHIEVPAENYDNVTTALIYIMKSNFPVVVNPQDGYYFGNAGVYKLELEIAKILPPDVVVPPTKKGFIALLIDDGGANLELAERLTSLEIPVTLAVLPHLQYSRSTADLVRAKGKSVYLHFPMQPLGYPATDPGVGAILMDMPEMLIKATAEKNVENLGRIDGVNNHMGSAVTQDAEKIAQALEGLRPYTTNFVDSNTSPNTVAFTTCSETEGFRCGLNRKFLDNENDHNYIKGKLTEAVALAKQQGSVIAIGHLRPDTIAVLEEMIPRLQAQGISFVEVNAVLR